MAYAHLGQEQRIAHLALHGPGKSHEIGLRGSAPDEGSRLVSLSKHVSLCDISHTPSSSGAIIAISGCDFAGYRNLRNVRSAPGDSRMRTPSLEQYRVLHRSATAYE